MKADTKIKIMNKKAEKLLFDNSILYLVKADTSYETTLTAPKVSYEVFKVVDRSSKGASEVGSYGSLVSEALSSFGSLIMIDPSGSLIKLFINLKIITYFSMVNVYYGEVLESFLIGIGISSFPKTKLSKNDLMSIPNTYYGKFSNNDVSLTMTDHVHYKVALYSVSWVVNMVLFLYNFFVGFPQRIKNHNKLVFYFRLYHSRIHFALFQMVTSSCIILNTRSLLHLKFSLSEAPFFIIFDKILSTIIFFAYWIDLFILVSTSLNYKNHKALDEKRFTNTTEEKETVKKVIKAEETDLNYSDQQLNNNQEK